MNLKNFPLSPALSPSDREQENLRRSVGESGAAAITATRAVLFPLLIRWGKGQGEGLVFN